MLTMRKQAGNSWKALYDDITSFLEEVPLKDGAEWISKMMRHDKLALVGRCRVTPS